MKCFAKLLATAHADDLKQRKVKQFVTSYLDLLLDSEDEVRAAMAVDVIVFFSPAKDR